MKLVIDVIGCAITFAQVRTALEQGATHGGAELLRRTGLEVIVGFSPTLTGYEELRPDPDAFRIIVVDGDDIGLLARIAELRLNAGLTATSPPTRVTTAPVIATVPSGANLQRMSQYCRVVTDWLFTDFTGNELAFRMLAVVAAFQRRIYRLACGEINLAADSRDIGLNGKVIRLSPSEHALAEFFLDKAGSVVTLSDLITFFEESGKSSAMNNIRVAIYQLRLKLEELSNFQLTIATLYRRGYVLRQAAPSFAQRQTAAKIEVEAVA